MKGDMFIRTYHISLADAGGVNLPYVPDKIKIKNILKRTGEAFEVVSKTYYYTFDVEIMPVTLIDGDISRYKEVIRHSSGVEYSFGWKKEFKPRKTYQAERIGNIKYSGLKRHDKLSPYSVKMTQSQYEFYRSLIEE